MFIRKKNRNGACYHYLVENVRVDGRVRQKVLVYLGQHKSVKAAYRYWQREAGKPEQRDQALKMLAKLEPHV